VPENSNLLPEDIAKREERSLSCGSGSRDSAVVRVACAQKVGTIRGLGAPYSGYESADTTSAEGTEVICRIGLRGRKAHRAVLFRILVNPHHALSSEFRAYSGFCARTTRKSDPLMH
jgi:hypothetical protein